MAEKAVTKVLCRNFPRALHKQLKMLALEQDTTLQGMIVQACEEFVQREKKQR